MIINLYSEEYRPSVLFLLSCVAKTSFYPTITMDEAAMRKYLLHYLWEMLLSYVWQITVKMVHGLVKHFLTNFHCYCQYRTTSSLFLVCCSSIDEIVDL